MIPTDLAARLRVLLESSVQPLRPAHEIPGNLPRFEAGQRFTAQIQNPLPDGSFRALVAGKTMTLALPESAKNGDVMELVVTGQRGNTILARQAPAVLPTGAAADDMPRPTLSQTGLLISQLLTGRFGEAEATPLTRGAALLPGAPHDPRQLVPMLRQAVSQSGLFYESHLRQWVEGKLPLEKLLQEPQARLAPLPHPGQPPSAPGARSPNAAPMPSAAPAATPGPAEKSPGTPIAAAGQAAATDEQAPIAPARQAHLQAFAEQGENTAVRKLPESLMPVVQQQLEALATHQMSWQGQVWPGMQMQWDITDPNHQEQAGDEETPQAWRSTLRLSLPRLGEVNAQLILGPHGISVLIDTDNGVGAERMRVARHSLATALKVAGVPLTNLQVSEHARA